MTVTWRILDGYVQFNFSTENYWGIFWRGGCTAFAAEVLRVARGINRDYLSRRTVGGLRSDFQLHWAASLTIGHLWNGHFSMRTGGLNPNKPGFDWNSVFFEGENAIRIARRIVALGPWGTVSLLRDIARRLFR